MAVKAVRVTSATSLSKEISLQTAEGDKVTISYRNDTRFQAASYDAVYREASLTRGPDGALMHQRRTQFHADLFAYSQERRSSLSVEGDLNDQERQDIREALERIDRLMIDTLQGGDLRQGAHEAAGIIGLESIAAVDVDYRYQSFIAVEEMRQAASVSRDESLGPQEETFSSFSVATHSSSSMDQLRELIDRMAAIIEDQVVGKKLKPDHFIRPLEKLFADHLERLEDEPQARQPSEIFRFLGQGLLERVGKMSGQD